MVLTGQVRVVRMPPGKALLLLPSATARGLGCVGRHAWHEHAQALQLQRADGGATRERRQQSHLPPRRSGGSVSVATRADGTLSSRQEFDPWGNVRSGGVSSTTLNYTGQRRDDTGLQTHRSLQDAHQRTTSHQRASARFACQTQVLTRGRIRRYVYAANSSARDHRASVQDLPRLDCGARVPRTRPGRSVLRAVRTATTPCVAAQTGT